MARERVLVTFKSIDKFSTKKIRKSLKKVGAASRNAGMNMKGGVGAGATSAQSRLTSLKNTVRGTSQKMTSSMDSTSRSSQRLSDRLQRFSQTTRNVKKDGKGFENQLTNMNMAMLGVMFAGMQLSAVMGGILGPAKKAFGIGDMFSSMLTALMAPALSSIIPYLTDFISSVTDLSKFWKKVIGAIVIGLAVLGKLIFIFGAAFLAINAFLQIQPQLTAVWNALTSSVAVAIATFIAVVVILKKVKDKFGLLAKVIVGVAIVAIAALLAAVVGGPAIIAAAVGAILGVIFSFALDIKDIWHMIRDAGKEAFMTIKIWVEDKVDAMLGYIQSLKDAVGGIIDKFNNLIDTAGKVKGTVGGGISSAGGRVRGAVGGIFNDFIMTDNGMQRISPNDELALMGSKDGQFGGGGGGGGAQNVTINVDVGTVSDKKHIRDIADEIEERLKTKFDGRM